jgi:hypothetical protein
MAERGCARLINLLSLDERLDNLGVLANHIIIDI